MKLLTPLNLVVIWGFCLRLIFILVSDHVYYPDEIFQSLEQAHKLVWGYGIIPWDFSYGLRSYVVVLVAAIPMMMAKMVGIEDPSLYKWIVQVFMIMISMWVIIAGYYLAYYLSKSSKTAFITALVLSSWYELIYFAPRALSENLALACFSLVIILFVKKPVPILMGLGLIIGVLFRIQYGFMALGLYLWINNKLGKADKIKLIIGAIIGCGCFGGVDIIFGHTFLKHVINNFYISWGLKISEIFGTKPWWFYVQSLFVASGGLFCLIGWKNKININYGWLNFFFLGSLGLHSLVNHKEYRFIVALIPLWIVMVTVNTNSWLQKLRAGKKKWVIIGVSIWFLGVNIGGILGRIPTINQIYPLPFIFNDPSLRLYRQLYKYGDVCGIFDTTRTWEQLGGFYTLHKNIPWYSVKTLPNNETEYNYVISTKDDLEPYGMVKAWSEGGYYVMVGDQRRWVPNYYLYKTYQNRCTTNPYYTNLRSFEVVEKVLKNAGIVLN